MNGTNVGKNQKLDLPIREGGEEVRRAGEVAAALRRQTKNAGDADAIPPCKGRTHSVY